jgi:release factor glutamine methyltransferase
MSLSEEELAQHHLDTQAKEIAEMKAHTGPFETHLADVDITIFPKVYPGGIDSDLMCNAIGDPAGKTVLDLCTGNGIVAIKAAMLGANKVVAVDLNPEAVKNAEFNAEKLGLSQIEVREGSLFEPVDDMTFDIIAINPPYTDKKPIDKTEICFWDEDNATTRRFFKEYKKHLNPNGAVFFAWADFSSLELIDELAQENSTTLDLVESRKTGSGLATFLVYKLVDSEISR